MNVTMLGTGGHSGVPLMVAGLLGLAGAVFGLVRAGRPSKGTVRAAWLALCVLLAIITTVLLLAGYAVEQLSNDPPL